MVLEIQEHIPLAPLTTFKIGGLARYLVDVRTENQIREAIEWARSQNTTFLVLSGGSNILVPDGGLNALVIRLVGNLWSVSGDTVDAWAGTNLLVLIRAAAAQGLGEWEKLGGIPGTIGGAVRGNAGAFGSEIKDFVTHVRALNIHTLETKNFTNAQCDFRYRHSFFKDTSGWIVIRTVIQLKKILPKESVQLVEETIAERERRHLQNVQAAGSFFMNPKASQVIINMFEKEKGMKSREGRIPAGWLIEKAGMKGATVGGAIASLQHPNYIVNTGNATSHDVCTLAQRIKLEVFKMFGIELVEEAMIL